MPAANPLVEEAPGAVPSFFSVGGSAGASAGPASVSAGAKAAYAEPGSTQTHLWVAGLVLLGLLALVAFHLLGFRIITDIGVTGR